MADQVSENDVESLGEKLEAFSQTLAPGEQAALIEILERATSQEGDVQGYVMKSTVSARRVDSVRVLVKSAFKRRWR
ncbi:MAG TPA: hypothetical protein VKR83_17800 [Ktedonobacteraceae bacterium]|nr:hypothetical protein [Ktedonobacteraceae bacterium]